MKKKRKVTAIVLCMVMVMSFSVVCLAKSVKDYDLSSVTKIKGYLTADFFGGKCSGWASTTIVNDQPIVPVQVYVHTYKSGDLKYYESAKNNTAGVVTKTFTKVSGTKVTSTHYAFPNKTSTTASNVVKLNVP